MAEMRLSPSGPTVEVIGGATQGEPQDGDSPVWDAAGDVWTFGRANPRLIIADKGDHFMGGAHSVVGNSTVGQIGELRWNSQFDTTSGSCAMAASEPGHPGILRIQSANPGRQAIYLGALSPPSAWCDNEDIGAVTYRFRPEADGCNVGLGITPNGANLGNDGIFIQANIAANANYRVLSRQGGSTTVVVTGVPVVLGGQFHDVRLERLSATRWDVYLDEVLVASFDSSNGDNVPSLALMPIVQTTSVGAGAAIVDLDAFSFEVA